MVATLNVSAQVALPDWVRGRGLAIFVTVFFGALSLGSAIWGEVANFVGLPAAHLVAAGGLVISIPLMWRWKVQTGAEMISHHLCIGRHLYLVMKSRTTADLCL